jgi:uncharacterized membrane protein
MDEEKKPVDHEDLYVTKERLNLGLHINNGCYRIIGGFILFLFLGLILERVFNLSKEGMWYFVLFGLTIYVIAIIRLIIKARKIKRRS